MTELRTPRHIRYLNIGKYLDGVYKRVENSTSAAVAAKRKAFGSSMSSTAAEALEVIPPSVAYSSSSAGGVGINAVDMLGGPEETLG